MSDLPALPAGYKLDQPPPPAGYKLDTPASVNTNATALGGADNDEYFSTGSAGAILDAFKQGAKDGWGERPLGVDPKLDKWLQQYAPDYGVLGRAFHDSVIRPATVAVDAALRAPGAVIRGVSEPLARGGIPADLTPEALFEAFPLGHATGFPAKVMPPEVARAADLGVIGKGEAGYQGLPEAVEALKPTGEPVARPVSREAFGPEVPAPQPPAPEAAPDLHAIARQIAPDAFSFYDDLAAQRQTITGHINDLAEQRAQGTSPEIAALDNQIEQLRAQRLEAPRAERAGLANQITALEAERAKTADALPTEGDTPEMARLRQARQQLDFQMRDLAPDVSAAYRRAAEEGAPEAATEPAQTPEPVSATTPAAEPEPAAPAPAAAPPAPPKAVPEPIPGGIVADVKRQLIAAGRPVEEADAAASLVQAHYETRAERFGGAKGTAEDLYRSDAPQIRAGRGVQPAMELAQKGELGQAATAPIDWTPGGGSKTIKLGDTEITYGIARDGQSGEIILVKTPHEARRQGSARAAMEQFVAEADKNGTTLFLNSDPMEKGITKRRLDAFYRSLGFVKNMGRNKDFTSTAEFVRRPELEQTRRGKIRLATNEAKATITLFKDADASTFIHESGHNWLEELVKDAADERAPADLKADAATVRQWLGVDEGEIPTRAHEKFARGFERYMMEGHAPSAKLAEVFAKFKDWLTKIYETVAGLRSPINDDIRGVFDRMLAIKEEPVIAPGEPPTGTFAELHELDAANTPPAQTGEAAAVVRSERDKVMEAAHPEIQDERVGARASAEGGGGEGGSGVSGQGGAAGEPNAASAGRVQERGAVGKGGSKPAGAGGETHRNLKPTTTPDGPSRHFDPTNDGLVDKAGNIRLDNLNAPDDIDAVIREAAARNNDFTTERRGVVSDGQLLDLADALGKDPSFLDEKKIGNAFSAEEVLAARNLLVQSATSVRDAMAKAASGGDAELAALAQAIVKHEMIQGKVSQAAAEWGRAGRAFRALEGWEQARDLNQFLKDNTGRDLNQLRQMAQLGKSLQTPGQISKFVADTTYGKVRQAIIYYWVNTLISGPITHLTYSVGNTVNALWTPLVETPLAATSGAIRQALGISTADRVHFEEVSAQLYGLGKGFRDGLGAAIEAYKSGVSPPLPGERIPAQFATPSPSPIPGPVGRVIGIPGKAVSAIHSFFKSVRYEQNIQALAMRDALSQGLEGNARDLHVARLTASPTEEMMQSAVADALKELYMRRQPYNSPGALLARTTNSWLPAKILAPFVKIGSEIVRNAFVERTPLGIGSSEIRGNLAMREGGAAFDTQIGKIMAGTGLMAATTLAVLEGAVTGDGPADPDERRIWLLNHQPNSVAVGPLTFSYARLGHLGMLVRFAANMTETANRWNDEEGTQLARSFFEGITRSVLDETWMRGVKDFMDAVYHSEEHFDRWATSFVAQWSPFSIGLGQVARKIDPYQRETRDLSTSQEILNQFKAHTPWLSETLPARRDVFGEPITNGSGTVDRYANDRVTKAMNDLNIGLATPQRKIRGVPLTAGQYDDYSRIAGRLAKMQLDAIIGPTFSQLPPETRIKLIKDTVSHAREAAASQVMMQSVGGENDIMRKAVDAKAAALHGAAPVEVKGILKAH